jgi:integrase
LGLRGDVGTGPKRRQRKQGGFATKTDAEKAVLALRAGIESGEHTEPSRERLERFLLEWLSTMEGAVRDSTFVAYRSAIRCQAIPLLGRHRLSDLSPAHLSDAYRKLLVDGRRDEKGGLSPATVRYLHVVLRQALQAAVEWGRLGKNPAQFVKPPRVAQPPQRTWDPQQLQRFLVQVRGDRLEALWWVLITTGCRRGEGLGLTWDAIDWQRGRLAIRQSVGRVYSTTVIHEPKTARARRSIGVDPDTLAVLKAHRERQRFERKPWGDAYADHGLVFCREDGRPLRPEVVNTQFRRHTLSAGLPPMRVHDLRHSFATAALRANMNPKLVADRLGHSTVSITLNVYSDSIPEVEASEAARVVGVILQATPPTESDIEADTDG